MSDLNAKQCYSNGVQVLNESGITESMSWFQKGMSYSTPEVYNKLCCGIYVTQKLWDKKFNDISCSYMEDEAYKAYSNFYESFSKGQNPDDYSLYFLGKLSAFLGRIDRYFSYDHFFREIEIYTGGELPYSPSREALTYLEFSSQCFLKIRDLSRISLLDVLSKKAYVTLESIVRVIEFVKEEVLNPTFGGEIFDRYPSDEFREKYITILTGKNLNFKTLPYGSEPKLRERNESLTKELRLYNVYDRLFAFCFLDASRYVAIKNGTFVKSNSFIV